MTAVFPEGVVAQGNGAVWFVPAIADVNAPTVTELNAGWNISCAVDGFSPGGDQGTSTDIRYCSTQQFEIPGRQTVTIDAIAYVYDPQEPDNVEMYEYYTELTPGRKGYMVNRLGLPFDTPAAAGQFVNLYPVTLGARNDVAIDPSAEGTKIKVSQKPFVSGPVRRDVALAGV